MYSLIEKTDELWDVYTKDREKTGTFHQRGNDMKPGEYHIVVHVCIFNSKNQLLIQQRQPFKKGWPNMWDVSVGGSAVAGDNSSQAAEREVLEELGLKIDLSNERPYFTTHFQDGFDDYYLVEMDIDLSELKLQEEEVKQVRWADKEEVLKMQRNGTMIPYWFLDKLFEIRQFYDNNRRRIRNITVDYATITSLESCMNLVEIIKYNFGEKENEEQLKNYKSILVQNIERGTAICAFAGNMVIGILLFSIKRNMISYLAVHPEYRRKKIATKMIRLMFEKLDCNRNIIVPIFRENDENGLEASAFYKALGFIPGKLCESEDNYPMQEFVLK